MHVPSIRPELYATTIGYEITINAQVIWHCNWPSIDNKMMDVRHENLLNSFSLLFKSSLKRSLTSEFASAFGLKTDEAVLKALTPLSVKLPCFHNCFLVTHLPSGWFP